jgi:hypothetical protein
VNKHIEHSSASMIRWVKIYELIQSCSKSFCWRLTNY